MPLTSVPDLTPRAAEIDDPKVLVHRVLYRHGKIASLLSDTEPQPLGEQKRRLGVLAGLNRADLHRLEELLDTIDY